MKPVRDYLSRENLTEIKDKAVGAVKETANDLSTRVREGFDSMRFNYDLARANISTSDIGKAVGIGVLTLAPGTALAGGNSNADQNVKPRIDYVEIGECDPSIGRTVETNMFVNGKPGEFDLQYENILELLRHKFSPTVFNGEKVVLDYSLHFEGARVGRVMDLDEVNEAINQRGPGDYKLGVQIETRGNKKSRGRQLSSFAVDLEVTEAPSPEPEDKGPRFKTTKRDYRAKGEDKPVFLYEVKNIFVTQPDGCQVEVRAGAGPCVGYNHQDITTLSSHGPKNYETLGLDFAVWLASQSDHVRLEAGAGTLFAGGWKQAKGTNYNTQDSQTRDGSTQKIEGEAHGLAAIRPVGHLWLGGAAQGYNNTVLHGLNDHTTGALGVFLQYGDHAGTFVRLEGGTGFDRFDHDGKELDGDVDYQKLTVQWRLDENNRLVGRLTRIDADYDHSRFVESTGREEHFHIDDKAWRAAIEYQRAVGPGILALKAGLTMGEETTNYLVPGSDEWRWVNVEDNVAGTVGAMYSVDAGKALKALFGGPRPDPIKKQQTQRNYHTRRK